MKALLAALLVHLPAAPALAAGDGSLTRTGSRAIGDPRGVAVSPDGRSVYVTSARADAVRVFRRSETGALRQLRGRAGCVRLHGGRRCRHGRAMNSPVLVAVSADGRNVYVAAFGSRAIAVFRRSPRTGSLRQLRGRAGCVREREKTSCRDGDGLTGLRSLAFSPNGRFVYAGTFDGVATFARDRRTGALTQVAAGDGTIGRVGDLAVDPTGSHLYASSPDDQAVAVFDVSGGVPRPAGCISESGAAGCTAGRTLNGVFELALSPDGRQLYAAAEFNGAVAILARDPATGALSQPPGRLGCIREGGGRDCAEARFLGHPDLIEMSRDGRNVYVRAEGGDVAVLRRDRATGALTEIAYMRGLRATAMALSRDGRNAYVTSGPPGGAVSVYSRAR
jgi:DNA-binding beta-propeller fold protein YncE